MSILNQISFPISIEHLNLLYILSAILNFIFFSYLSMVLISIIYSLLFEKLFKESNAEYYFNCSIEILDLVLFNKWSFIAFGILTFLSNYLIILQLFQLEDTIIFGTGLLVFILLVFTAIFIYSFQYSLKLISVLRRTKISHDEGILFFNKSIKFSKKSKIFSIALLLIAFYLSSALVFISYNNELRNELSSFISLFFRFDIFVLFLNHLIAGLTFATSAFLLLIFSWRSKENTLKELDLKYVKSYFLNPLLVLSLLLPIFYVINILFYPTQVLSTLGLIFTFVLFIFIFINLQIIYSHYKGLNKSYINLSFVFTTLIMIIFFTNDQFAINNSNRLNKEKIGKLYTEQEGMLKEKLGVNSVTVNGEDIYNGKCSACHKFDVKLVGPPYKSVLPKYEGKKSDLTAFILNPKKINPEYPPMPAQGLKPNEAEAVADYLLVNYKNK